MSLMIGDDADKVDAVVEADACTCGWCSWCRVSLFCSRCWGCSRYLPWRCWCDSPWSVTQLCEWSPLDVDAHVAATIILDELWCSELSICELGQWQPSADMLDDNKAPLLNVWGLGMVLEMTSGGKSRWLMTNSKTMRWCNLPLRVSRWLLCDYAWWTWCRDQLPPSDVDNVFLFSRDTAVAVAAAAAACHRTRTVTVVEPW